MGGVIKIYDLCIVGQLCMRPRAPVCHWTTTIWLAILAATMVGNAAHGAGCPDRETAKKGFVLERIGTRSVVRPSDNKVTVVTNEFLSTLPQTQFLVGGLVEVSRNSEQGRFSVLPSFDLRAIFPLKEGKPLTIEWLRLDAKRSRVQADSLTLELAGKEPIKVGNCKYEVLVIRQVLKNEVGNVLDAWTALYSPDLQMTLAKRYDERTAKEETVAFETIRLLAE